MHVESSIRAHSCLVFESPLKSHKRTLGKRAVQKRTGGLGSRDLWANWQYDCWFRSDACWRWCARGVSQKFERVSQCGVVQYFGELEEAGRETFYCYYGTWKYAPSLRHQPTLMNAHGSTQRITRKMTCSLKRADLISKQGYVLPNVHYTLRFTLDNPDHGQKPPVVFIQVTGESWMPRTGFHVYIYICVCRYMCTSVKR